MIGAQVTVHNAHEIAKALGRLPDRVQQRVLKKTLLSMARPAREAAKANAAKYSDTGALAESLELAVKVMPRKGRIRIKLGPRREAIFAKGATVRKPVRYAHLVEFGTKKHKLGKKSIAVHPGTKARPFLKPAFEDTAKPSLDAAMKQAVVEIEREAIKAGKAGA